MPGTADQARKKMKNEIRGLPGRNRGGVPLMTRLLPALLLLAVMAATAGCNGLLASSRPQPEALPYDGHTLQYTVLARSYRAQGRYELAREHYLRALATAEDATLRSRLAAELDGVDRLLLTQR